MIKTVIKRIPHTLVRTDFVGYDAAFVTNKNKPNNKPEDKIFVNLGHCDKSKEWEKQLNKKYWDHFVKRIYHNKTHFIPHGVIFFSNTIDYKVYTEFYLFEKDINFLLMK